MGDNNQKHDGMPDVNLEGYKYVHFPTDEGSGKGLQSRVCEPGVSEGAFSSFLEDVQPVLLAFFMVLRYYPGNVKRI